MACCQWAIVRFCHLCAPLAGTVVVGSQGLPCGSIGTVTMEQELVVDCFPSSHHSTQIPHPFCQGPRTYEAILLDHPQQSMALTKCGLPRSPRELARHQSFSGCRPPKDGSTVTRVRPTRPAIALSYMSSCASANISYVIPTRESSSIYALFDNLIYISLLTDAHTLLRDIIFFWTVEFNRLGKMFGALNIYVTRVLSYSVLLYMP